MFGNTEKVLHTLKRSSAAKENIIAPNKTQFVSLFEAIDKATNQIKEGINPDPSTDDLETQRKKLYEIAEDEDPANLPDKEGYTYLGASAQENFYCKFVYDAETKKLTSIQVLNSVDEEVANVNNEQDQTSAKIISDLVDTLHLDSISFKLLTDIGAIDLETTSITPADGGEGGGSGGPAGGMAGQGVPGAETDAGTTTDGQQTLGTEGGQEGGQEGPNADAAPGAEDAKKKSMFTAKEGTVRALPVPWAKTIKETTNLFESKEAARAKKSSIPAGNYAVIEKGSKLSLVAKMISEKVASSKDRYLVSNESLDISISQEGVRIIMDDGQTPAPAAEPKSSNAMAVDQGSIEPIDIVMDEPEPAGEKPAGEEPKAEEPKDMDEGDEFEIPEGVLKGKYKIIAERKSHFLVEEKDTKKKLELKKDQLKKKKKVKEAKQIVKACGENGQWVTDPIALKQLIESPDGGETTVLYVENGRRGSELLSNMQGESVEVGQDVVKVPVQGAAAPAESPVDGTIPKPITPADANPPAAMEAKLPDVVNKTGQEVIADLLEKHGIKEENLGVDGGGEIKDGEINRDDKGGMTGSHGSTPGSTTDAKKQTCAGGQESGADKGVADKKEVSTSTLESTTADTLKTSSPSSKEDAGGTASINKDGQGKLDTGNIDRNDKGGQAPGAKDSSPAATTDAAQGADLSINKDGQGKTETGTPDLNDKSQTTAAGSGAGGAQKDAQAPNNSGAAENPGGGSGLEKPSTTSTSTLESKKMLEYIAKLEKEMNEETEPELKATLLETINWLKSKAKK